MTAISRATAAVAADADTVATKHPQNRLLLRFCFRYFGSCTRVPRRPQFPDPGFKVVSGA
jgi:hypothetical protein